jgi:DNA-binding transcriptional LysR family regulator
LEKRFNTQLFYRHKKGMSLTPEGQILLEAVKTILQEIQETEQKIREQGTQQYLKVGIASEIVSFVLPRLQRYFFENPQLKLALIPAAEVGQDAGAQDVWIAPTLQHPLLKRQSTLLQEPLLRLWVGLYAGGDYVVNPKIGSLEDLKNHRLIGHGGILLKAIPELGHFYRGLKPSVVVHTLADGEALAKAGLGIVHKLEAQNTLPHHPTADLVPILSDAISRPHVDVCFTYTTQKAYSQRFLQFQEHCLRAFREQY